jgi:hypothetical protein
LRNRPNFQVHRATFANKQIIVILTEMCFLPQLPVGETWPRSVAFIALCNERQSLYSRIRE